MSRKVNGSSLKVGDVFRVGDELLEVVSVGPMPLGHVVDLTVSSLTTGVRESVFVTKGWKYERLTPKEVSALNN